VRFTRLAVVFGVLALIGLCILASIGFTPAIAVLVTFAVLVLFVAVGNLVSGRPGQPRFARPPAEPTELIGTAPVETVPVETVPVETVPVETVPLDSALADGPEGAP
jgi:uncharacterized membrane protein